MSLLEYIRTGDGSIWVDDTSPDITYTSIGPELWQQDLGSTDAIGHAASTYNHTSHVIRGNGSLSFNFDGTGLSVFGTVTIRNIYGQNDPSWTCSIDGLELTTKNDGLIDTNRWDMCTNTTLPLGVHTAIINVRSLGTPFYLDFLYYLPAPSVSKESQIFVVDSANPIVQYDSNWTDAPNLGGHVNQRAGGTLSIKFNGTSISWIGFALQSFPKAPSKGYYILDSGNPVQFNIPGVRSQGDDEWQQTYFITPPIENGLHTLSVTYDGNEQATPLILDYFLISTGPTIPDNTQLVDNTTSSSFNPVTRTISSGSGSTTKDVPSVPTNGTMSTISLGAGSDTKDATSVPTNGTISSSTFTTRDSAATGAIIGGIIGALAIIVIFQAVLLILWRRRRLRYKPLVRPFMSRYSPGTEWVSLGHRSSELGNQMQPESTPSNTCSSGAINTTTKAYTRIEPPAYTP